MENPKTVIENNEGTLVCKIYTSSRKLDLTMPARVELLEKQIEEIRLELLKIKSIKATKVSNLFEAMIINISQILSKFKQNDNKN